jgi:hypothetical protein
VKYVVENDVEKYEMQREKDGVPREVSLTCLSWVMKRDTNQEMCSCLSEHFVPVNHSYQEERS